MSPAHLPDAAAHAGGDNAVYSARPYWDAAVGKVFKLVDQNEGTRNVIYTQVKGVRDAAPPGSGAFNIEVLCVEVTARTVSSKWTQSNICKEGVLRQEADTDLLPESFGEECPLPEFEKLTGAILASTNSYLDWVMQSDTEQPAGIDAPIELAHVVLTEMEAGIVRASPYLGKTGVYFLTANSITAAQSLIQHEIKRIQRGTETGEVTDEAYLAQKNEAIESLQNKMKSAAQEMEGRRILATVEAQKRDNLLLERRRPAFASLQLDSLTLALLGKPAATSLRWMSANPSEDGPVFCCSGQFAPLEFVRWAHASGRTVSEADTKAIKLRDFFKGFDQAYTGPNREGFYPLLKPATE